MLKKAITYEDLFSGEQVTQDFYFNLTKAELLEMEIKYEGKGGVAQYFKQIGESSDYEEIMDIFKKIILAAYGEKTPDGKFLKSKQISDSFGASNAYSELIMEFMTNTQSAIDFMKTIVPKDLREEVEKEQAKQPSVETVQIPKPEDVTVTQSTYISGMSVDELKAELERRAKEA